MPGFTGTGKNLMLDALKGTNPTAPITHAGLLQSQAGKAITAVASSDTFTSTAHGYSNGDVVVLAALTGGTGLVAGDPYYVIGQTANTFQLSRTSGGSAVNFTSDVSAGTAQRLVELSGGSPAYARKVIAFNAAADGVLDDSTNGAVFDVPASATVTHAGFFSALTAGTLQAVADVTDEAFTGQGTYTLTNAALDLNG